MIDKHDLTTFIIRNYNITFSLLLILNRLLINNNDYYINERDL